MSFQDRYSKLLESTTLSRAQKDIIQARYLDLVVDAEADYKWVWFAYFILTNLITISGILIAALTPLEQLGWISRTGAMVIFWIVWGLAIALTLSNKLIYSFNIVKKYVLNIVILEKFYSEGWAFLSGIGRYSKCETDDERFHLFCTRIEKIKLKSIESIPEMEANETASSILAAGNDSLKEVIVADSFPPLKSRRSKRALGSKNILHAVKLPPMNDNIADDNSSDHPKSLFMAETDSRSKEDPQPTYLIPPADQ